MKRATQLLLKGKMNIAEVAYQVRFNDPKYFARAIKKEFWHIAIRVCATGAK